MLASISVSSPTYSFGDKSYHHLSQWTSRKTPLLREYIVASWQRITSRRIFLILASRSSKHSPRLNVELLSRHPPDHGSLPYPASKIYRLPASHGGWTGTPFSLGGHQEYSTRLVALATRARVAWWSCGIRLSRRGEGVGTNVRVSYGIWDNSLTLPSFFLFLFPFYPPSSMGDFRFGQPSSPPTAKPPNRQTAKPPNRQTANVKSRRGRVTPPSPRTPRPGTRSLPYLSVVG